MNNLLWRIIRKIHQIGIKNSKNPRPSSTPYISGDTFRALANKIHEEGNLLDPLSVKKNDIVFVESQILKSFFDNVYPHITEKYILISHNGDTDIDVSFSKYANDDKIIHWFAQNVLVKHPKITPIPIGLENAYYHQNGVVKIFDQIRKQLKNSSVRKNTILYSFNTATNPSVRVPVLEILKKNSLAQSLNNWPNPKQYLDSVQSYKFIASPRGNGEDCIRTWEAMLVDTIPIVARSISTEYFKNLGLPLFVVDSFEEINHLSEYDLSSKYDLIMSEANIRPLYIDYWKDIIAKHTNQ